MAKQNQERLSDGEITEKIPFSTFSLEAAESVETLRQMQQEEQ